MKVTHGRTQTEFDQEMTVRRLLEVMDVVSEGVVVAVNGELVTTDSIIRVGDEVEIIRAVSGGCPATHDRGSQPRPPRSRAWRSPVDECRHGGRRP